MLGVLTILSRMVAQRGGRNNELHFRIQLINISLNAIEEIPRENQSQRGGSTGACDFRNKKGERYRSPLII